MIIKNRFKLVSNKLNLTDYSLSVIKNNQIEENNPRHVFTFLELKKKNIIHFSNKVIFDLISNFEKREQIQVVNIDEYPFPVSYNIPTNGMLINLKPFNVKEIANMNPNDLYACIVYAYMFEKMVTGKFKINESFTRHIVNYFLSFYVQVFGKDYGLVGIYASGIPKLKFLIACYVLSAYFGYKTDTTLFKKAISLAPYLYSKEEEQMFNYDFSKIESFIKALSDLQVMPGITVHIFTSKLFRFFGINILPAIEDCARFFSVILTSSIPGAKVVPRTLFKYNEREYFTLIDIAKRMF